jgi:peptidoglycan/LPS O-acetylase OafA/YrhL
MEKYRRRLWVVISAAIIWAAVCIWLIFNPKLLQYFAQSPYLFFVLLVGGIAPICLYPLIAKRVPGHAKSLTLLAGGILLISVCGIEYLVFDIDNVWIDRFLYLGQALIFLSSVVAIWQGVRKSRAEKKDPVNWAIRK